MPMNFLRKKWVWMAAGLLALGAFFACNTTAPENKIQIQGDSTWLGYDTLVILRADSTGKIVDTLFHGKLKSLGDLNSLSAGTYDGGKTTFIVEGYIGNVLVLNQQRDYDGASGKTTVDTMLDASVKITKITLSQDTMRVTVGQVSTTLTASLTPSQALQLFKWKSLGASLFSVLPQNGDSGASVKIKGLLAGKSELVATAWNDSTKSDTVEILISDSVPAYSLSLTPDSVSLKEKSAPFAFSVQVTPTNSKVAFTVRDTTVATVDSMGTVNPLKPGKTWLVAKLNATVMDSSILQVTVDSTLLNAFNLTPDSVELKDNGQVYSFKFTPATAIVTFVIRDTSVASVDSTGRVRTRQPGKTWLVARNLVGKTDSSIVMVVAEAIPPGSVLISPDSISLKEGGKVDSFHVAKSSDLSTAKVTFASRDTAVVKVDTVGRIRTGKPGQTWVVASIAGGNPDSSWVEVYANLPPTIRFFRPDTLISINDTVSFEVSAGDSDGNIQLVDWQLAKDSSIHLRDTVDKANILRTRLHIFADTGVFVERVRVVDDNAANARDSVQVHVILDPPVVTAGRDTAAKVGESILFTGLANQQFGRIVMWKWNFDGDTTWDDSSSTSANMTHAYFKAGRYLAQLYARDDDGNVGIDSRLVVITNSPLVLYGLTPRDTVISIKDSVHWTAQATDSGSVLKQVTWDYNGDKAVDETVDLSGKSMLVEGGYRFATAGVYKTVVTVTDTSNRISQDTATITVKLDPPIAKAGADTTVFTGTAVVLHARGVDSLGTIVKYEWNIAANGFKQVTALDTSFTAVNIPFTYVCVLRVTDDDGNIALDTVNVKVALHTETRLDSLKVSNGNLRPKFHADSLTYRDTVGSAITSVQLSAFLRDSTASMTLKGKALVSGSQSDTLPLAMGLNSFSILVTGQDTSAKRTYTLNVVRIDDIPPSRPIVTVQDSSAAGALGRPIWSWTTGGGGGGGYRYKLDDTVMTTGATPTTGVSFQPDTNNILGTGYHTLYVEEKDSAGNWSAKSSARTWVGPITWYKLDNSPADSGLNGIDLSLSGPSFTADRSGVKNDALVFNGTTDFASLGTVPNMTGPHLTVSFWFLNSGTGALTYFLTSGSNIGLWTQAATVGLAISTPLTNSASGTFSAGKWTHFVGTFDGATIRVYINGVLTGTAAQAGSAIAGDLSNMRIGGSSGSPWAGTLDDIRFYRRVLTAAEVAKLYKQ